MLKALCLTTRVTWEMSLQIPRLTRRDFIRIGGIGITGYSLSATLRPYNVEAKAKV